MQILVVADTHGDLRVADITQEMEKADIDAVFTLGDVSPRDIKLLQAKFKVPFFGVGGNHDAWNTLKDCGVQDLHARVIRWNGIVIAGFGGSLKYKLSPEYMLFTEEEAEDILRQMPECDILLTHAAPKYRENKEKFPEEKKTLKSYVNLVLGKKPKHDDSISSPENPLNGLYGIGEYIHQKHPQFVLHGHLHQPNVSWESTDYGITCVRCFNKLELFELEI